MAPPVVSAKLGMLVETNETPVTVHGSVEETALAQSTAALVPHDSIRESAKRTSFTMNNGTNRFLAELNRSMPMICSELVCAQPLVAAVEPRIDIEMLML